MRQHKKSYKALCLFALLVVFTVFIPHTAVNAFSVQSSQYIYDDAELLTDSEITRLNEHLTEVANRNKINLFILTTEETTGYTAERDIDNFKVACDQSKQFSKDCVILLINMTTRDVSVSDYGKCMKQISVKRTTAIREDITPSLSAGNYYEAFNQYIDQVDHYMNTDYFYFQVWFQLLIACGLAAIIVAIMAVSRGSHVTTNASTYLDQEHSRLKFHHDNYIRTTVTKVRKPENNNNSSGGGSFGGGGGSHNNSTGKF